MPATKSPKKKSPKTKSAVKKKPSRVSAQPAQRMSFQETMNALEKAGSAQTKKTYLRHGAGEPMFGVSFATLKVLYKRIKVDQELAQALWGNVAVTQAYLTLSEVLGHVDLLVDRGQVRELELGGVIRYEAV